ncbi:MAG: hypothetical protein CM15mV51_0320 [uncultured marine virus]|nr:MAG: hypothetical protein CM15mV51_0320 [uncultured marine virus]
MGKAGARDAFESGTLTRTFLTNMEAAHLSKIANDIETYLMWGKGGRIKQDGQMISDYLLVYGHS